MNPEIIAYYEIMNILDDHAIHNRPLTMPDIMKLHSLAKENDITIEDIADANDCGDCHEWTELVAVMKEQFKSGERVPIESSEFMDHFESDLPEDTLSMLQDIYTDLEQLYVIESGDERYDSGVKDGIGTALDLVEQYYDKIEMQKN